MAGGDIISRDDQGRVDSYKVCFNAYAYVIPLTALAWRCIVWAGTVHGFGWGGVGGAGARVEGGAGKRVA